MTPDMNYWYFNFIIHTGDQPYWFRHHQWQAYIKDVDDRVKPGDVVFIGNQGNGIYAWGTIWHVGEETDNREQLVKIGRGDIRYPLIQASEIADLEELGAIAVAPKRPFTFLTKQQVRVILSRFSDSKPPEPLGNNFILGSRVSADESLRVEYKDVTRPNIAKEVYEYAVAYARGDGGHIYFGICDDGIVRGLELDFASRNELRQRIEEKLFSIHPPLLAVEDYTINVENIIDAEGNAIPDMFVVVVEVKPTGKHHVTAGGKSYHKGFSGRRKI